MIMKIVAVTAAVDSAATTVVVVVDIPESVVVWTLAIDNSATMLKANSRVVLRRCLMITMTAACCGWYDDH